MIRPIRTLVCSLLLLFAVGACGTDVGATLGGLAGAAAGMAGTAAVNRFEAKVEDREAWRQEHARLASRYLGIIESAADRLDREGKTEEALAMLRKAMDFHETQWPAFVFEKAARQIVGAAKETDGPASRAPAPAAMPARNPKE